MPTRKYDQNTLAEDGWNVICDVCGFKFKSGDVKKRWDGLYVCKEDYEQRHPMDFMKGFPDDQTVPYSRPDTEDSAVTIYSNGQDASITHGTSTDIQIWDTPWTTQANCFIQDNPTQLAGTSFMIYKTATNVNTLDALFVLDPAFGTISRIPGDVEAVVVVGFDGTNWTQISYTTLGL
jgi:hypothetical protein